MDTNSEERAGLDKHYRRIVLEAQEGHEAALRMCHLETNRANANKRDLDQMTARAEKAERERDEARVRLRAADDDVVRITKERDEQSAGRTSFQQFCTDSANRYADERNAQQRRAESAEHKAAMLEAEVGQGKALAETNAKLRDVWARKHAEANEKLISKQSRIVGLIVSLDNQRDLNEHAAKELGQLKADYQRLILGTAHGLECWMDDCGWHCGNGCQQVNARLCTAAKDLAEAREQLAKGEWIIDGTTKLPACPLCHCLKPGTVGDFHIDDIGHRPTCWYARQGKGEKEAAVPKSGPLWSIGIDPEMERLTKELHRKIREHGIGPDYDVTASDDGLALIFTKTKEQTPQYKHDCAGCVFLGRHAYHHMNWDLWWRPSDVTMGCNSGFGPGWSAFAEVSADICDGVLSECRRRAVARGLVK